MYISGITITGEKSELYALSTQNIQSTVNITPLEITDFVIQAFDKTYDGTDAADAEVTDISGVLDSDIGEVNISGTAVFDSPDAGEEKQLPSMPTISAETQPVTMC